MNWLEGALGLLGIYPGEERLPDRGHMYVALAARPDVPAIPAEDDGTPLFDVVPGVPLAAVARGVQHARLKVARNGMNVYDVPIRGPYQLREDELFPAGGPAALSLTISGEVGGRRVGYAATLRRLPEE